MSYGSTPLALTVAVGCSAALVAAAFVGASVAQEGFDIEYTEHGGSADGPSPFTEAFLFQSTGTGGFEFGPDRAVRVRRADTGDRVTLEPPTPGATYEVDQMTVNAGDLLEADPGQREVDVYLSNGTVRRVNVTARGDHGTFHGETFAPYVVEIVDDEGTVLAATDPQTHAVRYEATVEYNGSALAVTRDPGVRSGWHAVLRQDVGGDGPSETVLEFDHDAGDDFFVARTAGTEFNQSRPFSVEIYENESGDVGQRLATLFLLRADENRVAGPVGGGRPAPIVSRFGGEDGNLGNLDVLRAVNAANDGREIGGDPVTNLDVLRLVNRVDG
jgi:hypothetical protein